jgi:hypothetical protein
MSTAPHSVTLPPVDVDVDAVGGHGVVEDEGVEDRSFRLGGSPVFGAYGTRANLVVDGAHARDSPRGAHRLRALEQVDDAAAEYHVSVVVALHGDLCDVFGVDDRSGQQAHGSAEQDAERTREDADQQPDRAAGQRREAVVLVARLVAQAQRAVLGALDDRSLRRARTSYALLSSLKVVTMTCSSMARACVAARALLDDTCVAAITAASHAARRRDRAGAWWRRNSARARCRPCSMSSSACPKSVGSSPGRVGGGSGIRSTTSP